MIGNEWKLARLESRGPREGKKGLPGICLACGQKGGVFFSGPDGDRHLGPCVSHGMGKDEAADQVVIKVAKENPGKIHVYLLNDPKDPDTDEVLAAYEQAIA